MPHRDDRATVLDVWRAAKFVLEFKGVMSRVEFDNDYKTQCAIIRQLEIIGEAAKRLSDSFKAEHLDIPWKSMAGMRDYLIHGYDDLDIERIWNTVTNDIPVLMQKIKPLLPGQP